MFNNKQRIMTINAKSLFKYFPKRMDDENKPFCFDTRKRTLYTFVVKEEIEMEECPMFHQFSEVLKEDETRKETVDNDPLSLYDKFLIMDFEDIFLPIDENATDAVRKWREGLQSNVRDLIENGFDLRFEGYTVHMMPFDKSGNMSRNGRISFVSAIYIKQLNERLNLGMDFSKIPVKLSKYYAYRGLYLSTSQRVEHEKFKITPETLVIVKDKRLKEKSGKKTGGLSYEKEVLLETAVQGESPRDWEFQEPQKRDIKVVDIPHDGVGLIVPEYSNLINDALGIKGANSFQIRLPFAKGMLHQVDVLEFINEFTVKGKGEKQYLYEDAFGIERDLRKARIYLTESMLKGQSWLETHCKNNHIEDPMQYYCEMLEKFNHGFYVSGTNLPYGHSKYTHLSYQTINTLAFEQEQFERIIERHGWFIENPIDFLKGCGEAENEDMVNEDGETSYDLPNWKRAIIQNPDFAEDKYISEQLGNIQKSLLSKMALGKILVEGQTRYLCRDLLPLMADLLRDEIDIDDFYIRYLYSRFYMPLGEAKDNKVGLEFDKYYAFFRNPHLSRNEQYIMRAFVLPESEAKYAKDGKKDYEHYEKYVRMYDKYFGHLTGIVMVPRGSTLPLCLGGADFDGDLVSVIFNQDVVDAVKNGVYKEETSPSLDYCTRVLPAIEIPSTDADEVLVPEYMEYQHIYNTFSNYIGRISNAAISIGQVEYARDSYSVTKFNAKKPTCAKCTLLTGLEIDAAKNGIHPNLDIILSNDIAKSGYLTFVKQFKTLKAEENFHYEKLVVSKGKKQIDGVETDYIEISAKSCETKVIWNPSLEETGTYINLLPKYFLQYYMVYEKKKAVVDKFKLKQSSKLSKDEKKVIDEFKKSCDDLIKLYSFYKNSFLKSLTKEKNKGYYAVENTEVLIMRMYDENQVDEKLFKTLPDIRRKIESIISDESVIQNIRERINTEQWQFQPRNRRGQVLEQIIGNGFKENDLTHNERNLLYHFNQQGYKLLWRIMDLIEGPRIYTYDEMYAKVQEEREKLLIEEFAVLDSVLNKEMKRYYENNTANIGQVLYVHCMNALKNIIGIYSLSVDDTSKLVLALYEKTKAQTNKVRFFWDVFSWEDMKCLLEDQEVAD